MRPSRRRPTAAFSLFSFQDIITSVTGIMILVTLFLALELLNRVTSAPPIATAERIESVEKVVAELLHTLDAQRRQMQRADSELRNIPTLDPDQLQLLASELSEDAQRIRREVADASQVRGETLKELISVQTSTNQSRPQAQARLDALNARISAATATLDEITKNNRVFYKPGSRGHSVWLLEIGQNMIVAAELGKAEPPRTMTSVDEVKTWTSRLDGRMQDFFMVVKPGGADLFGQCRDVLSSRGFDFGFHVVGADQTILDAHVGSGLP